jgi:hypothetical protein
MTSLDSTVFCLTIDAITLRNLYTSIYFIIIIIIIISNHSMILRVPQNTLMQLSVYKVLSVAEHYHVIYGSTIY